MEETNTMAKKIVRNAGIVAFAGAALVGSTVPANAFAQVPAAADLSYDYNNYETDYTAAAGTNVAPQAEYQTEYVAPAPSFQNQAAPAKAAAPVVENTAAKNTANSSTATGGHEGVVATAKTGIGTGYVWGGRSFGAWDCSGFVSYVYAQHGIKLTPYTFAMKNELRATANPQPGDIVFQNGYNHVGIYVGNGMMISALNPSQGTQLHPVSWMSVDGYYTAY